MVPNTLTALPGGTHLNKAQKEMMFGGQHRQTNRNSKTSSLCYSHSSHFLLGDPIYLSSHQMVQEDHSEVLRQKLCSSADCCDYRELSPSLSSTKEGLSQECMWGKTVAYTKPWKINKEDTWKSTSSLTVSSWEKCEESSTAHHNPKPLSCGRRRPCGTWLCM